VSAELRYRDPREDSKKAMPSGRTAKALLAVLGLDPALVISLEIEVRAGEPIAYRGEFFAAELPEETS
jgi:hypothetical protein